MARIPGPESFIRGGVAQARMPANIDAPGQAAQDLGRAISQWGDVANDLAQRRQGAEDDVFLATANADFQIRYKQKYDELKNRAPIDGEDFVNTVDQELSALDKEVLSGLTEGGAKPSQAALSQLKTGLINLRGKYGLDAVTFSNNAKAKHLEVTALSNIQKWRSYAASGGSFEDAIVGVDEIAKSLTNMMPADQVEAIRKQGRMDVAEDAVTGLIDRNPIEARMVITGGQFDSYLTAEQKAKLSTQAEARIASKATEMAGEQAAAWALGPAVPTSPGIAPQAPDTSSAPSAIEFVLNQEGGYVANDAGKGPTNYGINSSANPDIDVKGLSREGAAAVYKERYWDKIGGDNLPTAIRLQAFDAAVNMGTETAIELAEASGGDPFKFAQLRKQRYLAIAKANPDKAQYLDTWMRRTDEALAATDTGPTVADVKSAGILANPNQRIGIDAPDMSMALARLKTITDPEIRKKAEDAVVRNYNAWKAENRKQYQQASQIVEGGGSLSDVPVSIASQLTHEQIASLETRKSQVERGQEPETDWGTYSQLMGMNETAAGRSAFADMNLAESRHLLSKSDYEQLTQLQTDIKSGRLDNKDLTRFVTVEEELKSVFSELTETSRGKTTIGARSFERKFEPFEQAVQRSVMDMERQTGQKATREEIRDIAERLLIKSKDAFFDRNDEYAYQMDINQIPSSDRQKLLLKLQRDGLPITDANLIEAYVKARS